MVLLSYKKSTSLFDEKSEIATIFFEILGIKEVEDLNIKCLSIEEAKEILMKLKLCINKKLESKSELTRYIEVLFGKTKIILNAANEKHKEAFFQIKIYNLLEEFIKENDDDVKFSLIKDANSLDWIMGNEGNVSD